MALTNNPNIKEKELRKLHKALSHWAQFCSNFDDDLAKDVLQQSYLKIYEGKAVYKKEAKLKTWLFSVLRLTSYELQRKNVVNEIDIGDEYDQLADEIEDENSVLSNLYPDEEIESAINKLSLRHREIIFLSFYCDNTLSEISKILGIGIGTVRSEYHQAKVRLKLILSTIYSEEIFYEEKYS